MSGTYIYTKQHNMRPYIYLVKNKQEKVVYIGQQIGTKSINEYKGSGLLLNRAYIKYGEDYFERERHLYHPDVCVLFQKCAWMDKQMAMRWAEDIFCLFCSRNILVIEKYCCFRTV